MKVFGSTDYFVNHSRTGKFPWSMYHLPLESDLGRFLTSVTSAKPHAEILVIGCGLLRELRLAPAQSRFTVVDIDPRAIEAVRSLGDPRVREAIVVSPDDALRLPGRHFDAIYAKEVIEHVIPVESYVASLRDLLRPGGGLWVSTPNYGEPWLGMIEATFLEWVARRSGYTRKGMHPTRFSRRRLEQLLRSSGFRGVEVRATMNRLALIGRATRGEA